MAAESHGKGKQNGTALDTSRIKITIDEYDDCNKKLEKIANFLREGFQPVFDGVKRILENTDCSVEWFDNNGHGFQIKFNPENQFSCTVEYQYEIVPEYIACKALDLLKSFTKAEMGLTQPEIHPPERWEDADWVIWVLHYDSSEYTEESRLLPRSYMFCGLTSLTIYKVTDSPYDWEDKKVVELSIATDPDLNFHVVSGYEQPCLEVSAQIEAFSKILYKMILT
jgi:hypothetical protein